MPVYGLVITLVPNHEAEQPLLDLLRGDPRISFGERSSTRIALATETTTAREQRDLHEQLLDHAAVMHVDTTFVEVDSGISSYPGTEDGTDAVDNSRPASEHNEEIPR